MTGFVVHIIGPDDVIDYPDEITALREANAVNKLYLQQLLKHGDDMPLCVAIVKTKDEMQ